MATSKPSKPSKPPKFKFWTKPTCPGPVYYTKLARYLKRLEAWRAKYGREARNA